MESVRERRTRKVWIVAGIVAAIGLGVWVGKSASATTTLRYATGEWQLRDFVGTYPDFETPDAELSEVDCTSNTLILGKPSGAVGTSYENTDLNLVVPAGASLLVNYEMSATANAGAGAVRMFGYDHANGDTLNEGPQFGPAIVDPATVDVSGVLEIEFATEETVGTFGLTYDASNDTSGWVEFTDLRIQPANEGDPVSIALCAEPVVTATASPSPVVTTTTTAPATTAPVTTTSTTTTVPVTTTPACVNLNTATFEELVSVTHIGPDRAQQVINLRPFASIDKLIEVDGIGPVNLSQIKASGEVCAVSTTPVNLGASLPVTGTNGTMKVLLITGIGLLALGVFLIVGLVVRNRQSRS